LDQHFDLRSMYRCPDTVDAAGVDAAKSCSVARLCRRCIAVARTCAGGLTYCRRSEELFRRQIVSLHLAVARTCTDGLTDGVLFDSGQSCTRHCMRISRECTEMPASRFHKSNLLLAVLISRRNPSMWLWYVLYR
jgi:hypothetical protein